MAKIAKLTSLQVEQLKGGIYDDAGSRYNPEKDGSGEHFITETEIKATTQEKYLWVHSLQLSNYIPPKTNELRLL